MEMLWWFFNDRDAILPHNELDPLYEDQASKVEPAVVYRAEEYMRANLKQPINISDLMGRDYVIFPPVVDHCFYHIAYDSIHWVWTQGLGLTGPNQPTVFCIV